MIEIKQLVCTIGGRRVLDGIDLDIAPGSFTAVLGRNGSGKSTLARHLNALRLPSSGSVTVDGMNTADEGRVYDIRERVGMVFQNPDSQSVAAIVEDDTAFAPENLGLEPEETRSRVDAALDACGISQLRSRAIETLSGGQKQLTAIAGILAMRPRYMVFDEATAMLDPQARKRVLSAVKAIRSEYKAAVIWITHFMDEAAQADRVIVMDKGRIIRDDAPRAVFADTGLTERAGLELPECAKLGLMLKNAGYNADPLPLTADECADIILKGTVNNYK